MMKIGIWYDTVEETLFNLGLPPNRPDGYKGFLIYDTDGRLPRAAGTWTHSTQHPVAGRPGRSTSQWDPGTPLWTSCRPGIRHGRQSARP